MVACHMLNPAFDYGDLKVVLTCCRVAGRPCKPVGAHEGCPARSVVSHRLLLGGPSLPSAAPTPIFSSPVDVAAGAGPFLLPSETVPAAQLRQTCHAAAARQAQSSPTFRFHYKRANSSRPPASCSPMFSSCRRRATTTVVTTPWWCGPSQFPHAICISSPPPVRSAAMVSCSRRPSSSRYASTGRSTRSCIVCTRFLVWLHHQRGCPGPQRRAPAARSLLRCRPARAAPGAGHAFTLPVRHQAKPAVASAVVSRGVNTAQRCA